MYIKNGEQKSISQIRSEYPDKRIPEDADLSSLGYAKIEPTPKPSIDLGQKVYQGDPEEYAPGQWRRTWIVSDVPVETARARKHAERIENLEEAREAGFLFNGAVVDSSIKSQVLIQGIAQLAQIALANGTESDFEANLGSGWRASDGTIVATDAASVIAMAEAFAAHVAACDAASQAIKQAIDQAETSADVYAVSTKIKQAVNDEYASDTGDHV